MRYDFKTEQYIEVNHPAGSQMIDLPLDSDISPVPPLIWGQQVKNFA